MDHLAPSGEATRPALAAGAWSDSWLPWGLWSLVMVISAASTAGVFDEPALEVVRVVGLVLGTLSVATIGALVVTRGQAASQGWMLLGFSLFFSIGVYAYHLLGVIAARDPIDLAVAHVTIAIGDSAYVVALFGLMYLLMLMPDGSLPSARWRPLAWVLGLVAVFWIAQSILLALTVDDLNAWLGRSTLGSLDGANPGPVLAHITTIGGGFSSLFIFLVPTALGVRYHTATGEERQQLKWVLVGACAFVVWMALWIPQPEGAFGMAVQSLLPGMGLMSMATAFGLALFKYRLWDVDIVIRRSLVYGLLWLGIAAVYVAVAAGLGVLAGARFPVEIAIALTVVATLVFQPARRWLERLADRMVFGHRDSPIEAMQTFGSSIGVESRPRDIAGELAEVTRRVLGARAVKVGVDGSEPAVAGVWADGETTTVPLAWGEETFGEVTCLARRGERFDADDVALVEALATQAALTISHARLAARMLTAQESERRRIERDIHDGVQQDLATQIGQLALARSRANGDADLIASLNGIQKEMQRTLVEIRDLAQGIHPSVLRDGGLLAAIEDRCSRLSIRASINAERRIRDRRYDADLETAAYFTDSEAVANVVKHAAATSVFIEVAERDGQLVIEVADDGIGFDVHHSSAGSGFGGLADRLRALGGELSVESEPSAGTLIRARIPVMASGESL